ncbi:MAG: glutamate-5-semialdehyde dehydrogenase [Candidatus Nanopelagicaceae bacterium]|jgi:glutamate-5-semialdehyde dehydrogenase
MTHDQLIAELATKARTAQKKLKGSHYQDRKALIEAIADRLEGAIDEIVAANKRDYERERSAGLGAPLLDRLMLDQSRICAIASGTRKVAALPDPLGQIKMERTLANGLHLKQITVPFGVVGMVYEARPNVTVDAAVILLASGNAALLRGSSTARESNEILVRLMQEAIMASGFSPDLIALIPSENRDTVRALLHARGSVDLVIPRGSASLIRTVVDEARVPTIETGAGVCHIYFDRSADEKIAIPILVNAKVQRPSVCNAVETLLIHSVRKDDLLPRSLIALRDAGVVIHGDHQVVDAAKALGIDVELATDENFETEYGTLDINIAVVSDLESAVQHIDRFGTHHTEAIITEESEEAERFIALTDSAAVMINASTRFTDGEEMGFGAEIGISNQKLHARGPMGLEAMTTTTWIVAGSGQIRS